jgi:hypothetical protein
MVGTARFWHKPSCTKRRGATRISSEDSGFKTIIALQFRVLNSYPREVIDRDSYRGWENPASPGSRGGLIAIMPSNVRHSVKALRVGRAIIVDHPVHRFRVELWSVRVPA